MRDERVSVIIPAYRAANTIERALRSVAAQTLRPEEVVVVDDGSNDGTADIAEGFRPELGDIQLVVGKQENKGAGAARNTAIRASKGTILAFLDADDEWLPTKLARSIAELGAGAYTLVAHNGWIVDGDNQTLNDCARRFNTPGDPYENLYRRGYIDTCTVVARREAVIQAGGFDETLANAQDFELWLAMLRDPGNKFLVFDDVLSRYFIVTGSIMSFTERRRACALEVATRYVPVLKRRGARWLAALVFRILAIHFEAFSAHKAAGRIGQMVMTLPRATIALAGALVRTTKTGFHRANAFSELEHVPAQTADHPAITNPERHGLKGRIG